MLQKINQKLNNISKKQKIMKKTIIIESLILAIVIWSNQAIIVEDDILAI